jgi:uncharacterized protein YegP (UPF0339 family)
LRRSGPPRGESRRMAGPRQTGRIVVAGLFEVFVDAESHFRFRLKAPDGTVMAVSRAFDDKPAAVAGIAVVRECAGTGLISDLCRRSAKVPAGRTGGFRSVGPRRASHTDWRRL